MGMMKRLYIDFEICQKNCTRCQIKCSYPYHPENNGITRLRELVSYYLVCRKCEEAFCINACPNNALQKDEKGFLIRSNFLCVGCKSCVLACPFGTIPSDLPYYLSGCDFCIGRTNEKEPLCVETCPFGAIFYKEIEEEKEKNIFLVNENLVVRVIPWKKEEVIKR